MIRIHVNFDVSDKRPISGQIDKFFRFSILNTGNVVFKQSNHQASSDPSLLFDNLRYFLFGK